METTKINAFSGDKIGTISFARYYYRSRSENVSEVVFLDKIK